MRLESTRAQGIAPPVARLVVESVDGTTAPGALLDEGVAQLTAWAAPRLARCARTHPDTVANDTIVWLEVDRAGGTRARVPDADLRHPTGAQLRWERCVSRALTGGHVTAHDVHQISGVVHWQPSLVAVPSD